MTTLSRLNELNNIEFTKELGDIFEHSPWVAEKTFAFRPFYSVEALLRVMTDVVETSSHEEKLRLLRSHPQLGSNKKMSPVSVNEQQSAGLQELTENEFQQFLSLNDSYYDKFGFPFILAVKGRSKKEIYSNLKDRTVNSFDYEFKQALSEVYKIASIRLEDKMEKELQQMPEEQHPRIMSYGKGDVFAYRTFMPPLTGVKKIPESDFDGRSNTIFGVSVSMEISGQGFLPSFTKGDNSLVVATDSMKNFVQKHLGSYEGTTIEGFLLFTGRAFLNKYEHVDTLKMSAENLPFEAAAALKDNRHAKSGLVFKKSRNEQSGASIELVRSGKTIEIIKQTSEISGLQLVKVQGNSFTGFIRDEYTTLPEDSNRPLFIYLAISWEYENKEDASGEYHQNYAAAEQIKDIAAVVFDEEVTPSIQHLIFQIGRRVLERFPQLRQITFQSQNRTWDTVIEEIPLTEGKVYTEPRLPFGFQHFSVTKEDL
ncbi:factor-independent urate hydroxylase [Alteribacillus sp. HJP-4]|uniref:factor-independent urate hydroxylase n=1 Tax=Alteribacillus sp. HJP-4 TaxID=2775394 RepID=UPI0035CCE512